MTSPRWTFRSAPVPGLRIVEDILQGIEDVNFSVLDASDVVRHRLVGDIVNAYSVWDEVQRNRVKHSVARENAGRTRMSIEVNNESGVAVDESELVALSRFIFDRLFIHPQAELSILLVDEPAMEKLHIELMDEPGSTDVLSVPMDELTPGTPDKPTPQGMLGDIAICPQVAEVQARNAGHSTQDEMLLLTTHGILHLLGFDHAEPEEKEEMFGLQRELL